MTIEAQEGKDTNVSSRKGVFIPDITVEMFRNASLEGVEELMESGEMEDISLPSAQPEQSIAQERYEDLCEYFKDCSDQGRSTLNDRKEFKSWLDRMKWHVMECDKLARELEKLKSAQPEKSTEERPKGEWITDDLSGIISCSRCGNDAPMETTGGRQYKSKFCQTCGADMRGGQDDAQYFVDVEEALNMAVNVLTAQPERKTGTWIAVDYFADGKPAYREWECSACGCVVEDEKPTGNFCKMCGADMRGKQNE